MNVRNKTLILFALFFLKASNVCFGIDLLASTNNWVGDQGFSISNDTIFLTHNKKIVAHLENLNLDSGNTYKISFQYEWNGPNAVQPHDFLVDFHVPGVWDDSNFNFIPPDNLRKSGKHSFSAVFDCSSVPNPVFLRIIKLSPADIQINKFEIKKVSKIHLYAYLFGMKLLKLKIEISLVIWFILQFLFLLFVVKYKLFIKTKCDVSNIKSKNKLYGLFIIIVLIIICLLGISLKLRYDFLLSKSTTWDLLRQEWRTVEMEGENSAQKTVFLSKAPDDLNGAYIFDVAINISKPSAKKDEEVIVEFFGEDYDLASLKMHINIANESRKHLEKKTRIYFDNPPSNLFVMAYSTYNTKIEFDKISLTKCPTWKKLLFLDK